MNEKLRINFVMPPVPNISGGPLAILEYANRFIDRGHSVSLTTYPDTMWSGDNPFPWFNFRGPIYFKRMRNLVEPTASFPAAAFKISEQRDFQALSQSLLANFGWEGMREIFLQTAGSVPMRTPFALLLQEMLQWLHTMEVMPDCDLNIATLWNTTFPIYYSQKGKPVYFMQHYEEIFYPLQPDLLLHRLAVRMSYGLPVYKIANSSWLQKIIKQRYGQDIPFSNNGIAISDFSPQPKRSDEDGIVRVFTYSRAEDWKGFGDAVASMAKVRERYGARIEWNVFGYRHSSLAEDNSYAPYRYHPKLSFRELAQLYATSDIALCPSWYESFPLPPLEAMASGTAVVTTADGTEDYAFHEKNALIVKSRQVDEMTAAICRLVEDESLRARLAQAGRATAETLNWEEAVEKRERLLYDIHWGKTTYDVLKSAKLNLKDGAGIDFENAPVDLVNQEGLFWDNGRVFLLQNRMKRHVTNAELFPLLLQHGFRYIEIDQLSIVRTPLGPPIVSTTDLVQ